jgi:uncharacterized protein YkwD
MAFAAVMAGQINSTEEKQILAAQNAVRKRVGVPPLAWSAQLARAAARWARTLAGNGKFEHQARNPYGENLFEVIGATADPDEVVNSWAAEAKNYNHDKNSCSGTCGHYTQIVWRGTKEVGCASAARGNRQVWVCEYSPPGNYLGERPY